MKKLTFFSVCVASMLFLGSCSKGVGCYYSASEMKEIKSDIKLNTNLSNEELCIEEAITD